LDDSSPHPLIVWIVGDGILERRYPGMRGISEKAKQFFGAWSG